MTIRLASDVKIGTYAFSKTPVWGEAYLISAAVTTKDGQEYGASVEHLVSGEIIINDLPNNSTQHLKGQFEATFETDDGQPMTIQGAFDFHASMSIDACRQAPLRSDWPD
ncbi:MAG: hypothetical protein HY862_01085 [Chloroflexi bacterium]|nr:hypothetical protein [Chloroflexota bacterium]